MYNYASNGPEKLGGDLDTQTGRKWYEPTMGCNTVFVNKNILDKT
jgi:hypothetical protein